MAETTTLTLQLPAGVRTKLERLAGHTKTNETLLGAEAVSQFVTRELAIIDAIEAGRADALAGRVVPHEEVRREVDKLITAARTRR